MFICIYFIETNDWEVAMNKKIIAIGNIVMCDDGIGVKIAELLHYDFKLLGFETIVGETNIEYCMDKIKNDDFLVVLDSSYYDIEPGTVTVTPLEQIDPDTLHFSQNTLTLLELIKLYNKKISGFLISVEASEIYFNPDLSEDLKVRFRDICNQCLNYVSIINKLIAVN